MRKLPFANAFSSMLASLTAMVSVTWSTVGQAENFVSALPCKPADAVLLATNDGNGNEPFWLQQFGSQPYQEKLFEVESRKSTAISIAKTWPDSPSAVAVTARKGAAWQFQTYCKGDTGARPIRAEFSPWKSFERPANTASAMLYLVNLSQQKNAGSISYFNGPQALGTQEFVLDATYKRTELALRLPAEADHFKVKAEGRWTGLAQNESGKDFVQKDDVVSVPAISGARYFLFSSRSGKGESYVVPVADPKLISEATEQIANPAKAKILVAKIEKSFRGVNRDFSDASKSPWSWQAEAVQFGDFATIACDGNPAVVEERIDDWITNTGGVICFWNYRVEKELTEEEALGPNFSGEALKPLNAGDVLKPLTFQWKSRLPGQASLRQRP